MRNTRMVLAAVLVAVLPAAARADQKGEAILKSVEARSAAAKTLQAELHITARLEPPRPKLPVMDLALGTITLMRPNLARIFLVQRGTPLLVASDGKSVWQYNKTQNQYVQRPVDARGHNISLPASPLVSAFLDPQSLRPQDQQTSEVRYAGEETVGGIPCKVLTYGSPDELVKLYIGPQGVATGADIIITGGANKSIISSRLTGVKLGFAASPAQFAYQPPAGATKFAPLNAARLVSNGSIAPAFTLKTPQGGSLSLADVVKGNKATIVNFWFVECPPCKDEFPHLQKVYSDLKDKGLDMVAVNVTDSPAAINHFMAENKYTFRTAIGTQSVLTRYGVEATPASFVLNSQGKIVWSAVGEVNEAALRHILAGLGVK
ncbi:MAG TPA: redoxin domain-containing protein [Chthonomonadales bacterium]|nr:redoxin domain-containing protein [Chthonomonadales bacterium]